MPVFDLFIETQLKSAEALLNYIQQLFGSYFNVGEFVKMLSVERNVLFHGARYTDDVPAI